MDDHHIINRNHKTQEIENHKENLNGTYILLNIATNKRRQHQISTTWNGSVPLHHH